MAMTPEEEYRAAFNDGAEDQPPAEEAPPSEEMAQPEEQPETVEEPAAEATDNAPSDSAAEGTGETPAVAVVISPEGEGGESPMSPEDEQRARSWEGRLRKKEEELAAREAALTEKEQGGGDISEMACGGKVAHMADGGEVDDMSSTAEMEGAEAGEPAEAEVAEASPAVQRIREKALELMQSGNLDAALQDAIDNYGEEFVALSAALGGLLFDDMAQPYLSDMNSNLDALVDEVVTAFQSRDRETILDAHDDLDQIVENPDFQAWMDGLPEEEKARAMEIVDAGSPRAVIGLLKEFKAGATKDKTPDDIWAEDAAEGVKSSAPVQLPMKTGAAPEDEYKAAWDSM